MTAINYYFDSAHPLRPYTYSLPASPGSEPPENAVRVAPPSEEGKWPIWSGTAWKQTEDHRRTRTEQGRVVEDSGTSYWLPPPYAEDNWQSPARQMTDVGPLPEGAVLTRPDKPQRVVDAERRTMLQTLLDEIDRKSARPLRAVVTGTATDEDRATLADLEAQAEALRNEARTTTAAT